MNAVLEVREPSARYLARAEPALVRGFELLALAPAGVAKLRALIHSLAVRGLLVPHEPSDEPASALIQSVQEEKVTLTEVGLIKRDKPHAPISDDELPYSLPKGWEWIRLRELLTKIGAGSTPLGGREVYTTTGVKFLRSQNVWNNGLALDGVACIPLAVHKKMSGTKVVGGDLLFNITGASIGRCALVADTFDEGNVSQHVTIIRTVLPSIRQFLHLVLISDHVQQTVMDVQVGVSREGLSIAKLGQFVIPLPPLAEQQRIVARVEELMKLCDALEQSGRLADEQHARLTATLFDALAASESAHALAENWQRIAEHFDVLLDRPEAIDALEQTILQLAVRGLLVPQVAADESASRFLAKIRSGQSLRNGRGEAEWTEIPYEVPAGWEWCTLETVSQIGTGTTPSRTNVLYFEPAEVPWVTSGETGQPFIAATAQAVSTLALRDTSLKVYPVGTLIVAMYGQGKTRGQISELLIPATTNQACAAIVPIEPTEHHRRYIKLFFEKSYDELREQAAGGAQPNLNVGKIKTTLIPLPPLAEQGRIVARVEELRGLCTQLREGLTKARQAKAQLSEALVAQATTA